MNHAVIIQASKSGGRHRVQMQRQHPKLQQCITCNTSHSVEHRSCFAQSKGYFHSELCLGTLHSRQNKFNSLQRGEQASDILLAMMRKSTMPAKLVKDTVQSRSQLHHFSKRGGQAWSQFISSGRSKGLRLFRAILHKASGHVYMSLGFLHQLQQSHMDMLVVVPRNF